ncbi:hypothetical protein Q1695_011983 [Nippostrongylus brasiliensis]|nr:hypothetical protein Q1695_011983 [Nippostrongylus brasiliensis]
MMICGIQSLENLSDAYHRASRKGEVTQEESKTLVDVPVFEFASYAWTLRSAQAVIQTEIGKVEKALDNYSTAADNLSIDTPAIEEIAARVNENAETAQELIDKAHRALATLTRLQENIDDLCDPNLGTGNILESIRAKL